MAQGQLLESTQSFEIFAHGSKYLLVNENRWDVAKILSRLDNGNSSVHSSNLPCFYYSGTSYKEGHCSLRSLTIIHPIFRGLEPLVTSTLVTSMFLGIFLRRCTTSYNKCWCRHGSNVCRCPREESGCERGYTTSDRTFFAFSSVGTKSIRRKGAG